MEAVCPEVSLHSKRQEASIPALIVKQLILLNTLNVSGCKITDQGVSLLTEILIHTISLEILDISDTTLDAAKADKIGSALRRASSLKLLDISNNFITSETLVAITLSESHTIEEINISQNLLKLLSVVKIAQSFRQHPSLKSLDLSNNMISFSSACEFIIDIANFICKSRTCLPECVWEKHQTKIC